VIADPVFKLPYIFFYKIPGRKLALLDTVAPAALTTIGPLLVLAEKTAGIVAVSSNS